MKYQVTIKRKIEKNIFRLPGDVKKLFYLLVEDLKADGPLNLREQIKRFFYIAGKLLKIFFSIFRFIVT